jgi:Zn-dependent protease with chaperone function
LKPLIHRKETIYFILLLLSSIPLYAVLIFSGVGLIILGILVILPILAHLIFTATIRTNGVKITERQFPEIYQRTREIAKEMGFYFLPDIYVIESGGLLNAFATRFFGRNMIVLYADLFEMKDSDPKLVDFVIAHELAHIKRNHILKHAIILPANWIPFLGSAYSRACEYTCDKMAIHYINDFEASTRSLTMLAVGRKYYQTVDQHEYMLESSNEKGFFIWISEKLMSHPTLPKRMAAVYQFSNVENSVKFKTPKRVFAVAIFLGVLAIGAISTVTYFSDKIIAFTKTLTEEVMNEGETPLTIAVINNDLKEAERLIEDGADVNEKNDYDETPLLVASYSSKEEEIDYDMTKLLLENGADPSFGDVEEDLTVLHYAVLYKDLKSIDLLLQFKADINQKDSYGESPIFQAVYNDDVKTFEYLKNKGANLNIKNVDGLSIKEVAEEVDAVDILKFLNK